MIKIHMKGTYKMNKIKKDRGITLIALIVTIVVLLILAAVSINLVLGNNGLISKTKESKVENEKAKEKEGVSLAIVSSKTENAETLEITQASLEEALKSQFGNQTKFTITDNKDGSFIVRFDDTNREYYVEDTGKILENDKTLEITSEDDLKAFRKKVNEGNTYIGTYIYLTNDINLDINEEWEPIGTYLASNTSIADETNKPFSGTFDGKGHTISGLKITSSNKGKGLFGLVSKGTIKNLKIGENCNINGVGHCSGAICGYAYNGTIIESCYNNAEVNGVGQQIGGIAGQNLQDSQIINCYNSANIYAKEGNAGGIAGNNSGTINNSYNIGNVKTNKNNVGGISGFFGGTISNCYNTGKIEAIGEYCGGIAGILYGNDNTKIVNSYNVGEVVSTVAGSITGGLSNGSIENSLFLEKTVNGENGGLLKGTRVMKSSELKRSANLLGNAFKTDLNNINEGYPILTWQSI